MSELTARWRQALENMPLIAILRGLETRESIEMATVLFDEGFEILEVPLNSPDALETIAGLTQAFPGRFIGAGTVTSVSALEACLETGLKLVVTPNLNPDVATAVSSAEVIYCPGVMTPTEAFAAVEYGAHTLKLFPAEMIEPKVVKAIRAVLPPDTLVAPVGGITPDNMRAYLDAGANGFGIGSSLYRPGRSAEEVRHAAAAFVAAYKQASSG